MTNFFTGAPRHTRNDIAVKSRKTRWMDGQATRTAAQCIEGSDGETKRKRQLVSPMSTGTGIDAWDGFP